MGQRCNETMRNVLMMEYIPSQRIAPQTRNDIDLIPICPHCGKFNLDDVAACIYCKKPLQNRTIATTIKPPR